MSKPLVSVIVPAFDEEGNVAEFARRALAMFDSSGIAGEVLFVDDGSTDGTPRELAAAAARDGRVRVLTHRRNFGLTAALVSGFEGARGDVFVFYPADLQFDPAEIPDLVSPIAAGEADMVCGRKRGRYEKRVVSWVYNRLVRLLFKVRVRDMNSVKAFRREAVQGLMLRRDWHRYLVVLAADRGFRVVERDVTLRTRHSGASKFTGKGRVLVGFLDLASVWLQLRLLRKPLLHFGTAGIASLAAGMIVGLVAVYFRFIAHEGYRPLLYLVILLVLFGGLLFAIGFLAEAIVGVREEVERLSDERDRRA